VFWASKTEKEPRLVSPDSIFFKKHGNSFLDEKGILNSDLELRLSRADYEFSKIQHQIIRALKSGSKIDVTIHQRNIISLFIYVMWKRNPIIRAWFKVKFQNEFQPAEFAKDFTKKLNDVQLGEFASFFHNDWIQSTLGQAVIEDTLRISRKIIDALNLKTISCVTPKNDKTFIIGNNPLVWLKGLISEGVGDPESELWMPISPKCCLLLHKPSLNSNLKFLENEQVRFLNLLQWKQSESAVACSRELLRSIATSR
jgi:hypothetical protein